MQKIISVKNISKSKAQNYRSGLLNGSEIGLGVNVKCQIGASWSHLLLVGRICHNLQTLLDKDPRTLLQG